MVLCWHMHQPEYRDALGGRVVLPWVLLRALKDYSDMAAHLEEVPEARAVVNFSPVLLDQLEDHVRRLEALLREGRPAGEPLSDALVELPAPGAAARAELVAACTRPLAPRMLERAPAYREAAARAVIELRHGRVDSLPDQDLVDLVVLYLLAWCGESLSDDPRLVALRTQQRHYTAAQCRELLAWMLEVLRAILPRYRLLAERGRVELSMTPYYHPLSPLLIDFGAAREAAPGIELPAVPYPGGLERARWHLREGAARFAQVFGFRPRGCWPSEAALSQAALELIADEGFAWTASSQSVLAATLRRHGRERDDPHRPYRSAAPLTCFFRDDRFSDRIGFVYKDWNAHDAVADFVAPLEPLARSGARCVAVILDGENPWEWYANNGCDFVRGLYRRLSSHPSLRMATFSDCLADPQCAPAALPPLVAGSWVHGELLTWIGHPQKNRAWALLVEAKRRFDAAPRAARAQHLLGVCEGSDWFWWPGGPHSAETVADFDRLFRLHLRNLYAAIGESGPAELDRPLLGGGAENGEGGTMLRSA